MGLADIVGARGRAGAITVLSGRCFMVDILAPAFELGGIVGKLAGCNTVEFFWDFDVGEFDFEIGGKMTEVSAADGAEVVLLDSDRRWIAFNAFCVPFMCATLRLVMLFEAAFAVVVMKLVPVAVVATSFCAVSRVSNSLRSLESSTRRGSSASRSITKTCPLRAQARNNLPSCSATRACLIRSPVLDESTPSPSSLRMYSSETVNSKPRSDLI